MAGAAEGQRQGYNKHSHERSFKVDDPVWLSTYTNCWEAGPSLGRKLDNDSTQVTGEC